MSVEMRMTAAHNSHKFYMKSVGSTSLAKQPLFLAVLVRVYSGERQCR